VGQKLKQHKESVPLADRIAKARREGRTQQALELARQLYKHDPTAEHLDLLRQATFERGRQLQDQGNRKDAATVFANAVDMGGSAEFQSRLAGGLAACGAAPQALKLLAQLPADERGKILVHAADCALRQGAAGRALLSAELQPEFDLVLRAFAHAEKGDDDDARAALQGISLQSPFLEWKLLLRGLLAWYAGDDARALENWQRLDPVRPAWRSAAPLRAGIDAAFRQAQPAHAQQALRQIADRIGGIGLARPLQAVQDLIAKEQISQALRQIDGVLAAMRKDHPDLARRLEHCLFWAIADKGQPDDVPRFGRVFGTPPDDPNLDRLNALAAQQRGYLHDAQIYWQNYARQVADHPDAWPGEQAKRARAIIWEQLGTLSLNRQGAYPDQDPSLEPEKCFRRSLELAPQRLDPHLAMMTLHLERGAKAEAIQAGEQLLRHFPDHAITLLGLGGLHCERHEFDRAQNYFARALQVNPLDARARMQMCWIHQAQALELMARTTKVDLQARLDQAREHYQTALQYHDQSKTLLRCQLAVLETKAGQPERALAWIGETLATPHQPMAVALALQAEGSRAKLSSAQLQTLLAAAAAAPDGDRHVTAQILALIEVVRVLHHYPTYRNQKTDAKKALSLLSAGVMKELAETDLARMCQWLEELQAVKPWQWAYRAGQARFPKNPLFLLAEIAHRSVKAPSWRTGRRLRGLLERARNLAAKLPRETRDPILERIAVHEERLKHSERPRGMLDQFFQMAFGEPDWDEDDQGGAR